MAVVPGPVIPWGGARRHPSGSTVGLLSDGGSLLAWPDRARRDDRPAAAELESEATVGLRFVRI